MKADAIDQSWGVADAAVARAKGIRLVSMYLSHTPGKNITVAKIRAYHGEGIGVMVNWESGASRATEGAAAGKADAKEAVRQVNALFGSLGRPKYRLAIYFSVDLDIHTRAQEKAVKAYFAAVRKVLQAAGFLTGVYGEASVVSMLHAAGLTDCEWQTVAWSGGRLDPQADLYQFQINQKLGGAAVDFNKIIHANSLGAWWPDGDTQHSEGDDVSQADVIAALKSAEGQRLLKQAASNGVWGQSAPAADGKHKYKMWEFMRGVLDWSEKTGHEVLDSYEVTLNDGKTKRNYTLRTYAARAYANALSALKFGQKHEQDIADLKAELAAIKKRQEADVSIPEQDVTIHIKEKK